MWHCTQLDCLMANKRGSCASCVSSCLQGSRVDHCRPLQWQMHCHFYFCLQWSVNTGLQRSAAASAHGKIPTQHWAALLAHDLHTEHDIHMPLPMRLLLLLKSIAETPHLEPSGTGCKHSHQTSPCSKATLLHYAPLLSIAVLMLSCQHAAAHSLTEAWCHTANSEQPAQLCVGIQSPHCIGA